MAYQKFHQDRINLGLCVDCGKARGDTGTTICCRICADKRSKRSTDRKTKQRAFWKEQGLCYTCGGDVKPNQVTCDKCRAKAREYFHKTKQQTRSKKDKNNECKDCKLPRFGKSKCCKRHWAIDIARKTGCLEKHEQLLEKLEKQDCKCFYTGIDLIAGVNASIDHLESRKNSPDKVNDLNNLVWCDRRINSMKGSLNYEEFVNLCNLIAKKANYH